MSVSLLHFIHLIFCRRHIRRISGHQRPVKVLRPINGQPRLISGSSGGEVKLWDLQKGELVFLLDGFVDFGVTCLDVYDPPTISFTPLLAAGGSWSPIAKVGRLLLRREYVSKSCQIWDLESGTAILLRGHTQYIQTIVVDRDVVYTGSMDTTVRTWCANTGSVRECSFSKTLLEYVLQRIFVRNMSPPKLCNLR